MSAKPFEPTSRKFVSDLSDWIRQNGSCAKRLTPDSGATFVDNHGVRRFLHNWQPAEHCVEANDFADETIRYMVHHTGCRKVVVSCIPPVPRNLQQPRPTPESQERTLCAATFLSDWERLWIYFEADNEDEIAEQAPLLRAFVEFFFHRTTCLLMIFLYLYNLISLIFLEIFLPSPWGSPWEYLYEHLSLAVQPFVYLALLYLYKGVLLEPQHPYTPPAEMDTFAKLEDDSQAKRSRHYIAYHSLEWKITCSQLLSRMWSELHMLVFPAIGHCCGLVCCCCCCPCSSSNSSAAPFDSASSQLAAPSARKRLSYYRLLNVALKFLTRFNGIDPKKIDFNRSSYRLALLFIGIVLPLYIILFSFVYPYAYYVSGKCHDDYHGDFCQYYWWEFIVTLGLTTRFTMQYLYAGSVLLSLVGLAYGGEITHRLATSWMDKFCSLRKVHVSSVADRKEDNSMDPIAGEDSAREVKMSMKSSSKRHTAPVAAPRADARTATSNPLTKDTFASVSAREAASSGPSSFAVGEGAAISCSSPELQNLLLHDATEHYLFIREVMSTAGSIWSIGLTGLLVLAVYVVVAFSTFIVYFLGGLSEVAVVVQLIVVIIVRTLFLVVYPIVSICHANTYIYDLLEVFRVSAPGDYEVLGGRDRWVELLSNSPAVWTYYGFWVTYDRLFGVFWALAMALGAYVLSVVLR